MSFLSCPRCSEAGYQIFATHAYCVGCNYSPDFDLGQSRFNRRRKAGHSGALRMEDRKPCGISLAVL